MRDGFKVIDTDLHILEPLNLYTDGLEEPYRSLTTIELNRDSLTQRYSATYRLGPHRFSQYNSFVAAQAKRRFTSDEPVEKMLAFRNDPTPANLVEALDMDGIDVAVIVPTQLFVITTLDGLDPQHALALCRTYNDWVAEFVAKDRDRLRFWAWLPRQDAQLAAEEARRCVKELGADGVAVTSGAVDGRLLSDPHFEPLWEEIAALDVPFGIHLWGTAPLLRDDPGHRHWEQPHANGPFLALNGVYHAMSAIAEMTYSGVFERHPNLRTVIMEASNGWLLFLLDRLDEKWELYEPEFSDQYGVKLPIQPSEYFRRQCFITCEGEEHALKYLVDYGLADNLLFSSDFPHHDSPWPHSTQHLLAQPLSDEAKRKILWESAQRAFRWKEAPGRFLETSHAELAPAE